MPQKKNAAAVALGRRGGRVTSAQKTAAVQKNGRRGGRPRNPPDVILQTLRICIDVARAQVVATPGEFRDELIARIDVADAWARRLHAARNTYADRQWANKV